LYQEKNGIDMNRADTMASRRKSEIVKSRERAVNRRYFKENWPLYIFILPALISAIIFKYIPMYGAQIAFRDYSVRYGIWASQWVGLKYFIRFVNSPSFWLLIRNTLLLNGYNLIFSFPAPIILALLINEVDNLGYKRTIQMLTYAPHFISTVAVIGLVNIFLKRETGLVNIILEAIGVGGKDFLADPGSFRGIYIISGIWQNTGWGTIIYLAALSSVDQEMIESALIDGATRLQRMRYINFATIFPTIIILLILNTSRMLNVGFEKVFLLQNKLNMDTADVISTYVYRLGIQAGQFSYTSAIGLFNSLINACILIFVNAIARRVNETSLW
jgi:putative aldouronate transport system permease protein